MNVNNEKDHPFISALLVTYNEEAYIETALLSLINQTYPKKRYEILIIDGMSTDKTIGIVNSIVMNLQNKELSIRILENCKKILAAGWNIGIRNSIGDYVVRIDAHASVDEDFLEKSMETMLSVKDVVCVGGKLITKSLDENDDTTVSKVLSSPFGVGNSSFRVSNSKGYVDTAVYGLYKKCIFEEVGYFDESLVRNQDIELHARIKKSGGKFYFNPEIKSTYYARNTVRKMLKQAYQNGKWNPIVQAKSRNALSIRHVIPFAFVIFLLLSSLLGITFKFFWYCELGVVLLHFFLGFVFAKKKTNNLIELIRMPLMFMGLHIMYGIGYLVGLFNKK